MLPRGFPPSHQTNDWTELLTHRKRVNSNMAQDLSLDGEQQVIFDADSQENPLHWEQTESVLAQP